jgi:hypothetical protein
MTIQNANFCAMKSLLLIEINEYSVLAEEHVNIIAACHMTSIIASFFVPFPRITFVSTDSDYNMLHFTCKATDIFL